MKQKKTTHFRVENLLQTAPFARLWRPILYDRDPKFTDGAKLTYFAIEQRCAGKPETWISQESLAVDRGIELRSVQRHVAYLVDRGLLTTRRRGRGQTNIMRLADPSNVYGQELFMKLPSRKRGVEDPPKTAGHGAPKVTRHKSRPRPATKGGSRPAIKVVQKGEEGKGEETEGRRDIRRASRVGHPEAQPDSLGKTTEQPSVKERSTAAGRKIALMTIGESTVKGALKGFQAFGTDDQPIKVPAAEVQKKSDFKAAEAARDARERELAVELGQVEDVPPVKDSTSALLEKGWAKLDAPQKCSACGKSTTWMDPEKNVRHARKACRLPATGAKPAKPGKKLTAAEQKQAVKKAARARSDAQKFAEAGIKPQSMIGPSGAKMRNALVTPTGAAMEFFFTAFEDQFGPMTKRPGFTAREVGVIDNLLLKKYCLRDLEKMARLLVLDWDAMRDSYWKARDRSSKPTFAEMFDMHDYLFGNIGSGVDSHQFRHSEYSDWLAKNCPKDAPAKKGKKGEKKVGKNKGYLTGNEVLQRAGLKKDENGTTLSW